MNHYPQKRPVENGRILQGRVAGGGEGIANCKFRIGNCKLRTSGLQPSFASARNPVLNRRATPAPSLLAFSTNAWNTPRRCLGKKRRSSTTKLTRTHEKHPRHHRGSPRSRHQRLRTQEAGARLHGRQVLLREKEVAPVLKTSSKQRGALETVRPVCLPPPISSARYLPPADWYISIALGSSFFSRAMRVSCAGCVLRNCGGAFPPPCALMRSQNLTASRGS